MAGASTLRDRREVTQNFTSSGRATLNRINSGARWGRSVYSLRLLSRSPEQGVRLSWCSGRLEETPIAVVAGPFRRDQSAVLLSEGHSRWRVSFLAAYLIEGGATFHPAQKTEAGGHSRR